MHPSLRESLIVDKKINESIDPNRMYETNPEDHIFKRIRGSAQKYWRKFEEGFVKPNLIFDYFQRKEQIKLEKLKDRA